MTDAIDNGDHKKAATLKLYETLAAIRDAQKPIRFEARIHGSYGVARAIAGLLSLTGWIAIAGGAIFMLQAFGGPSASVQAGADLMVLAPGAAIFGAGFLIVASGQITRAVVDTADYNAQQLQLLQKWMSQDVSAT